MASSSAPVTNLPPLEWESTRAYDLHSLEVKKRDFMKTEFLPTKVVPADLPSIRSFIPPAYSFRIPSADERPNRVPDDEVCVFAQQLERGLSIPPHHAVAHFARRLVIPLSMIAPNTIGLLPAFCLFLEKNGIKWSLAQVLWCFTCMYTVENILFLKAAPGIPISQFRTKSPPKDWSAHYIFVKKWDNCHIPSNPSSPARETFKGVSVALSRLLSGMAGKRVLISYTLDRSLSEVIEDLPGSKSASGEAKSQASKSTEEPPPKKQKSDRPGEAKKKTTSGPIDSKSKAPLGAAATVVPSSAPIEIRSVSSTSLSSPSPSDADLEAISSSMQSGLSSSRRKRVRRFLEEHWTDPLTNPLNIRADLLQDVQALASRLEADTQKLEDHFLTGVSLLCLERAEVREISERNRRLGVSLGEASSGLAESRAEIQAAVARAELAEAEVRRLRSCEDQVKSLQESLDKATWERGEAILDLARRKSSEDSLATELAQSKEENVRLRAEVESLRQRPIPTYDDFTQSDEWALDMCAVAEGGFDVCREAVLQMDALTKENVEALSYQARMEELLPSGSPASPL